jgi:hypothetical protein
MTDQERITLLRSAQNHIRMAMREIQAAVADSAAYDRATVYTLLWLGKVVGDGSEQQDIGNIDDLIDYFESYSR